MSYTTTPLGLQLPVPGSGQAWSTAVYNSNLTKLDTAIGVLQDSVGTPTAGTIANASGFSRQGSTYLNRTADGYVEAYVHFSGSFPNVTAATIGTLPAGFRPTTQKVVAAAFFGGDIPDAGTLQITPAGELVTISSPGAHSAASAFFRFKLGT